MRLKRQTAKKRLRRARKAVKEWLPKARAICKLPDLWQALARKIRGHFNYVGVSDKARLNIEGVLSI